MGSKENLNKQEDLLSPDKELVTEDGYKWFYFSGEKTLIPLICLEDIKTGIVVTATLANPDVRTSAIRAWAGARHSRSPKPTWGILHEIVEKGVDADQKVEETTRSYGHASVGDMSRVQPDINFAPLHMCFSMFNESAVNGGQEGSTRFQKKYGEAILHDVANYLPEGVGKKDLEFVREGYESLGRKSLENFAKYKEILNDAYTEFFKPNMNNSKEATALESRVLDSVRFFVLFGQVTKMSFEDSSRDISRVIGELKGSPLRVYKRLAAQLERLLAPTPDEEMFFGIKAEAPGLIRHTEVADTTNNNLKVLKAYIEKTTDFKEVVRISREFKGHVIQKAEMVHEKYTEAERMIAQYLVTLWPGADTEDIFEWVHIRRKEEKKVISNIVYAGHSNYKELPVPLATTTGITIIDTASIGEVRDLGRHRAWGRYIPLPLVFGLPTTIDTITQVLSKGFILPSYIEDIPQFGKIKDEFIVDMNNYYIQLFKFIESVNNRFDNTIDYSFVYNLLPLAHATEIWMHGNPKQALYETHQRVRPGGHINYILLTHDSNRLISESDPYLDGIRTDLDRPDPADRERFFDRS